MKAQIEVLLSIWGRWAIKRDSGALGYPSASAGFQDYMPPGTEGRSKTPLGIAEPEILAVDQAVNRLLPILRMVVIEVYQRPGSVRDHAKRLGIGYTAIGQYLTKAHAQIALDIERKGGQNPQQLDRVQQCALAKMKPAAA